MPTNLAQDTTKSAKSLAQQIAKQMAREPLEILKDAGSQVSGQEMNRPQENRPSAVSSEQQKLVSHQNELNDKMKSSRMMEALKREIDDINKQNIFKDLQYRISQGEEVPLQDYSSLSMEQKQVLNAQMEAVTYQKKQQKYVEAQNSGPLFGSSKKGRKMGGGQKGEAEKQQTRVEKPVPPSG